MKFKRIPSRTRINDYPDFSPGDLVRLRGKLSYNKNDICLVLRYARRNALDRRNRKITMRRVLIMRTHRWYDGRITQIISNLDVNSIKEYFKE